MAVQGPSKDFSVIRAEAAFTDIMQLLKDKYDIERPQNLNGLGIYKKWQDEWDADEVKFKALLAELVWNSDAAQW